MPGPPKLKPTTVSKLSRKMQQKVLNPKPIANYVKKPVPKIKKKPTKEMTINEENEEQRKIEEFVEQGKEDVGDEINSGKEESDHETQSGRSGKAHYDIKCLLSTLLAN